MGPGHGFEFCWVLTPRRIIWAICLASQHTHLHLCPLCESPEEGPWGRWEVGSQAVCGGALSGQACQVGEGSRRTSTEKEVPGVGPLTPPPPGKNLQSPQVTTLHNRPQTQAACKYPLCIPGIRQPGHGKAPPACPGPSSPSWGSAHCPVTVSLQVCLGLRFLIYKTGRGAQPASWDVAGLS